MWEELRKTHPSIGTREMSVSEFGGCREHDDSLMAENVNEVR